MKYCLQLRFDLIALLMKWLKTDNQIIESELLSCTSIWYIPRVKDRDETLGLDYAYCTYCSLKYQFTTADIQINVTQAYKLLCFNNLLIIILRPNE